MKYEKKISICMMIKNEENNLDKCLKSLNPVLESGLAELIIIDTGSNDNSINIAKDYTDKLYEHPWTNDFSEMRNISISYAKGEWIWIIDADEELETPEEAIELFNKDINKYNTISIRIKNYMESPKTEKEASYNMSVLLRIFRNNGTFKYSGSIHEQPKFENPIFTSDIIFKHYGYIWEDEEFTKKKYERTSNLLKKEIKQNPNDIYLQFQLAVSTSIMDKELGLDEFRKAYSLIEKIPFKNRYKYIYVYGIYSINALNNQKYNETIKICREGLSLNSDYVDLWFTMFSAYSQINDENNILKSCEGFLESKKKYENSPISKDPSLTLYYLDDSWEEKARYSIILINIKNRNYDNALKHLEKIKTIEFKSKAIAKLVTEKENHYIIFEHLKILEDNAERDNFITLLEEQNMKEEIREHLQKEIINLYESLGKKDSYYFLNCIRESIKKRQKIDEYILQELQNLDYDDVCDFYGDFVTYLIRDNMCIDFYEFFGDSENLERLLKYSLNKYKDLDKEIYEYLINNKLENNTNLKYWLILARNVLLLDKLDDYIYMKLFKEYIIHGLKYIKYIYRINILDESNIYDIHSKEHRFFIYLQKAHEVKESNEGQYIRYLRKALKVFPIKRAIKLLLQDIQDNSNKENKNEFEEYKLIVKKNIGILIESKKINEAKVLIEEYLKIVPNDLEMLTLKSEIQLQLM